MGNGPLELYLHRSMHTHSTELMLFLYAQAMGVSDYFNFTGCAWLFMGVANSDSKLYDEEFQEYLEKFPDRFRLDYALSREQKNKSGGKMYIQVRDMSFPHTPI